jgi:hypothetical protein
MSPIALAGFGLFLFLALVALAHWKHRRDTVKRMNKGLREFVATEKPTAGDLGRTEEARTEKITTVGE